MDALVRDLNAILAVIKDAFGLVGTNSLMRRRCGVLMICEAATLLMEMSVTVVDKWVVHGFVWVDVDVDDSDEVWGWCHARGVGGGDDGGEVIAALRWVGWFGQQAATRGWYKRSEGQGRAG